MDKIKLNELLDISDKPVSKIEMDLGMPSGTLAKAKKGVRELPAKWDEPLTKYFLLQNNKKENEPKNFSEGGTMLDQINLDNKIEDWVAEIEKFCSQQGILPSDLIESYKSKNKGKKEKDSGNEQVDGTEHNFTFETPRYKIVNGKKIFK